MERLFREVFEEWLARELPENIVERELRVEPSERITAIIGPRRAGKTYLMFYTIKNLLSEYEKENILYVDFSDIRLRGLSERDFSTFLKVLHEVFREGEGRIFLFLDEVQELPSWDYWVRTLHNLGGYYIVLSGSSSKLLSREVATQLRGRYVSRLLLPFSFREFLRAKGFEVKYLYSPERRGLLLRHLKEYVRWGGFPEVVLSGNKGELLKTYVETVFYRDVVDRYRVRDVAGCEIFLRLLIESFGKRFSVSKAYNYFRSIGVRKSKRTLWNYLRYFREAFFVLLVEKFSFNVRERIQYPVKLYAIDTGFYPREDLGLKMENIVALELMRRGAEYFYFQTRDGYEVDFLVRDGLRVRQLVQVTYAGSFDEVDRREWRALLKAYDLFREQDPELVVLTWDYEDERRLEWFGRSGLVRFVPLWRWLLQGTLIP